jgi:hypothetical protein
MFIGDNKIVLKFKGTVTKEFIDRRQKRIDKDMRTDINPYFQWDSEFPECHQCQIDPKQKLFKGFECDTIHEDYGYLDYKQYSKNGVHVSKYIQKQIVDEKINYLVIWRWVNGYKQLYEGNKVTYEILGYVSAKEVLSKLNSENRFYFEVKNYGN